MHGVYRHPDRAAPATRGTDEHENDDEYEHEYDEGEFSQFRSFSYTYSYSYSCSYLSIKGFSGLTLAMNAA